MTNTRPLEITTTTHAIATWVYGLQVVQGIAYIVGVAQARSMTDMVTSIGVSVWSIVLVVGGLLAFIAIRMARTPSYTLPALRVEMWAALAISVASFWYEITLFLNNGILEVFTTQSYALALAGACAHRVFQIRKERRRVIERLTNPTNIVGVVADREGK